MTEDVKEKANTQDASIATRPITSREIGQPHIVKSSFFTQELKKTELRMPARLCTFDTMMEDDAVFNAVDVTNLPTLLSLTHGAFKPSNKGSVSKAVADFLNYNIRNMSVGTWLEAMNNACTDLPYGFSLQNIVTEKAQYGPYKGRRVIKKLAPRSQDRVYAWVWDKDYRDLKGFVQKPMITKLKDPALGDFAKGGLILPNMSAGSYKQGYPFIRKDAMLHFRYNPKNNIPEGDSPLVHCYDAWVEKSLVERYEVIGVAKDMGGSLVVRVPSKLIQRAADPTNYPLEAAEYTALQQDAASLHAGESSYILLSSDVNAATKARDYDIEFKGIDGGGKQYNTQDIIDRKNKSIYNTFGAGFLLLGQDSVGSYALSSSSQSTHAMYVQRNVLWKKDVIENQLARTILLANNLSISYEDMPTFEAPDPEELSLDELGKFIQRVGSVQFLTPDALETLYLKAGLPLEGLDKINYQDSGTSAAGGDNGGSSGTGGSQDGGAASDTNSSNKGLVNPTNLIMDGDSLMDTTTGMEWEIPKIGEQN